MVMRTPEVMIRPAVYADISALVGLLKDLFSIEADFVCNEALHYQGLKMMLNDRERQCIMVAENRGTVIGMCSVQTLVSTAEGGIVGLVEDMVIHKRYRGQGIGSKLLDSVEHWAREKGLKRLQLLADRNNLPALEFYRKRQWQQTQLICLRKK
jgi:GNAT superfamily N-acetyltransferase